MANKRKRADWYGVKMGLTASSTIPGIRSEGQKAFQNDIVPGQWFDHCRDDEMDIIEYGHGAVEPYEPAAHELEVLHLLYPAAFSKAPQAGERKMKRAKWLKLYRTITVPSAIDGVVDAGQTFTAPRNGYVIIPGRIFELVGDEAYALLFHPDWKVCEEHIAKPAEEEHLTEAFPAALDRQLPKAVAASPVKAKVAKAPTQVTDNEDEEDA